MFVDFIAIELDLDLIFFLQRFYSLELRSDMKRRGSPVGFSQIVEDLKEKFEDLQARGYLKNKYFKFVEKNKGRRDVINLITYFGEDYSIQFKNNRMRELFFFRHNGKNIIDLREDDSTALPYDEVLIMPSPEIYDYKWLSQDPLGHPVFGDDYDFTIHRQLHIKQKGGVSYRELKELLKQRLPDYYYWDKKLGDVYENLIYFFDHKGIPVYFCHRNHTTPNWYSQSMGLKDKNGNL